MSRLPIFTIIRGGPADGQVWLRSGSCLQQITTMWWSEGLWLSWLLHCDVGTQDAINANPLYGYSS